MKATTEDEFAAQIKRAGGTARRREPNEILATKGDRYVRAFFDDDGRFYEGTKVDKNGRVLRTRDMTLRSLAAVERYLGL